MSYQTFGIILRQMDRGEADQFFTIYAKNLGKITALGRGTKKITSKLNYHLQSLAVVDLFLAPGKNFFGIAGVNLVYNFSKIKNDFKKIIFACFALELVDKLTKTDLAEEKIYHLLIKYFLALEKNNFTKKQWAMVQQAFVVKFLTILGLAPKEEIAASPTKLDNFLNEHLEAELLTKNFLQNMVLT